MMQDSPTARHRCLVYDGSPAEQLPVIAALLADGLRGGWRSVCLGEPATLDAVADALERRGVDVAEEKARGALILSPDRPHLKDGGFRPQAMLEGLERMVDDSLARGFNGVCASGDMAWELGDPSASARLLEYEALLDALIARKPLRGICQYRRDALPPRSIGDALRTHHDVFLGADLVQGNPFYLPPDSRPLSSDASARDAQSDWMAAQLRLFEQRLRERTQELEDFTHAVAHDLKAPLRAIEGFSTMIERRHGQALPPDARELFSHVILGTRTLGELIDSLMSLSRLSTKPLKEERVDLSALAHGVVSRLRRAEPQREVAVDVQPGLEARGDGGLLASLMENLLSNAWKFTARAERAQIVVARGEHEGRPAFAVRDNGAGFEPSQGARLFQAFQRLHSKSEFPGTGLGLTSVKRIVERHGGQVWAEGRPGKGASFYFTLPAA